jgi:hypothetical protein
MGGGGKVDKETRTKLRRHLNGLRGHRSVFAELKGPNIEGSPVIPLSELLGRLEADFPDLAPHFDSTAYFSHYAAEGSTPYYKVAGLRAHIGGLALEKEAPEVKVVRTEFIDAAPARIPAPAGPSRRRGPGP